MQSYISRITEIQQQLSDIGSPLDDEFVAVAMLIGLTNDFDRLIIIISALENSSKEKLTADGVKTKLVQKQMRRYEKSGITEFNALALKKPFTCYRCKKPGHMKKDCPNNNSSKKPNDKKGKLHFPWKVKVLRKSLCHQRCQ